VGCTLRCSSTSRRSVSWAGRRDPRWPRNSRSWLRRRQEHRLGGAAVAAEEAGASTQTIVGRRGFEVYVRPGTNAPARIGGREFTGHALDQMQGRGITPSMVKEALANGTRSAGRDGARIYRTDDLKVVVNPSGSVKTVMWQ